MKQLLLDSAKQTTRVPGCGSEQSLNPRKCDNTAAATVACTSLPASEECAPPEVSRTTVTARDPALDVITTPVNKSAVIDNKKLQPQYIRLKLVIKIKQLN
jgi:hypothetical protein